MNRRQLSTTSIFFSILSVASLASSLQADDFVVKQATYSQNGGVFRCEAKLVAGESATLTLTAPSNAQAAEIEASIHSNLPAKITQASTVVTVVVLANKNVTASVTYQNMFDVSKAYNARYAITLKNDVGSLNGYLQVTDQSSSSCNWDDAKLFIDAGRPKYCVVASMDAGKFAVVPLESIDQYKVKLEPAAENIIKISNNAAYYAGKITNGDKPLHPGSIRIMKDGSFLGTSRLSKSLTENESAYLPFAAVPSKFVKAELVPAANRWHEFVSMQNGILTYKPASVSVRQMKNNSGAPIKLLLDDSSDITNLSMGKVHRDFKVETPASTDSTADLYDISEPKLIAHVKGLTQLAEASTGREKRALVDTRDKLKGILDLKIALAKLQATQAATVLQISELNGPEVDPDVRRIYVDRLQLVKDQIAENKKQHVSEVISLAKLLSP